MASDEAKAIGNAILEGVPAIMSALETLTEIHPFLKGSFYHYFLIIQLMWALAAAYLPFKLIYHQYAILHAVESLTELGLERSSVGRTTINGPLSSRRSRMSCLFCWSTFS
jgi:hypothetical protein